MIEGDKNNACVQCDGPFRFSSRIKKIERSSSNEKIHNQNLGFFFIFFPSTNAIKKTKPTGIRTFRSSPVISMI